MKSFGHRRYVVDFRLSSGHGKRLGSSRGAGLLVFAALQMVVSVPALAQSAPDVIYLNSDWITEKRRDPDHFLSPFSVPREATATSIDFEVPTSILRFVLRSCDLEEQIFPSERYFYFRFFLSSRCVSGNLRFTDAEDGSLHIGYFDTYEPKDVRHATFGPDSVSIEVQDSGVFNVTFEDLERNFSLEHQTDLIDQEHFERVTGDGLRFVSRILDESGYGFYLVYSPDFGSFAYVLDDSVQKADDFVPLDGTDPPLFVGKQSRFVFLERPGDLAPVLVGVSLAEVEKNSYFDGPFDQVPPKLPLRKMLEIAYPYVKERGGIDQHGNFLQLDGQRVAISPYQQYSRIVQLRERLSSSLRLDLQPQNPAYYMASVREWKMDFRPQKPLLRVHSVDVSPLWPANHRILNSRAFPRGNDSK